MLLFFKTWGLIFRNILTEQDEVRTALIPKKQESHGAGIGIMLFITFLASVCFSIVLPSINPLLLRLVENDATLATSLTGWAVAINSIGSFLASPFFGWWADRRSTREVLAITLIAMTFGNVLYSLANKFWLLLIGRFIVGTASGRISFNLVSYLLLCSQLCSCSDLHCICDHSRKSNKGLTLFFYLDETEMETKGYGFEQFGKCFGIHYWTRFKVSSFINYNE